jgi:hypothetical protein
MDGTIYRGWETQGVTAPKENPRRQPLVPWPQDNPYGPGLILTQEVARQPL